MVDQIQGASQAGRMMQAMGGRPPAKPMEPTDELLEKLSEATGLTTEELESKFEDGSIFKTLKESGISRSDFTAMNIEALNEAVEAGTITQAEADAEISRMSNPPPPPPDAQKQGGMVINSGTEFTNLLSQIMESTGAQTLQDLIDKFPSGESLWQYMTEQGFTSTNYGTTQSIVDASV